MLLQSWPPDLLKAIMYNCCWLQELEYRKKIKSNFSIGGDAEVWNHETPEDVKKSYVTTKAGGDDARMSTGSGIAYSASYRNFAEALAAKSDIWALWKPRGKEGTMKQSVIDQLQNW